MDPRHDWKEAFLSSPGFARIPRHSLEEIFRKLTPVTVKRGELIIKQGSEPDYFYLVAAGRCEVTRNSEEFGALVKLSEFDVGDCVGEDALVSGQTRNANVHMLTDGVLMRMEAEDFRRLLIPPMTRGISYAEARTLVAEGARYLDVRLPGATGVTRRLPNSVCIPFPIIRARVVSIRPETRYVTACKDGAHSAIISFTLNKLGFETFYLDGGIEQLPDEAFAP